MYGKNEVKGSRSLSDRFLVHSIFYTIQGEGPYAGRPAIFVRFADCCLRCFFCDTNFTGGTEYSLEALAATLTAKALEHKCGLFVFTGGEPLLQEVFALAIHLRNRFPFIYKLQVQVETAGISWPASYQRANNTTENYYEAGLDEFVTIVCSPKTPKIHSCIEALCHHWKYIIRAGEVDADGLPNKSTQKEGQDTHIYRQRYLSGMENHIYIQPCDEASGASSAANLQEAVKVVLAHPAYRLSIQIHKIAGLE